MLHTTPFALVEFLLSFSHSSKSNISKGLVIDDVWSEEKNKKNKMKKLGNKQEKEKEKEKGGRCWSVFLVKKN